MMMSDGWIVIPGWAKFQHYPDTRGIVWVKDYLDQLDRDEYLELTFAERGLLLDLRKLYARRRGLVRSDTKTLSRALTKRVTQHQLDSLNHAGFIEIVASRPLALARSREEEEIKKKNKQVRTRTKPETQDPFKTIVAMIRNGAIHDRIELDAEINGSRLSTSLADELREMLPR